MPRFSVFLSRIASGVSAILVLGASPSWAQNPPTLPPGYAESPEFRARIEAAAADSSIQPWQREFMLEVARGRPTDAATQPSPTLPGLALPSAAGIAADDGAWTLALPPSAQYGHTAIYDPVRGRMVVFGGEDITGVYFGDVRALSLAGSPAWSALAPAGALPSARSEHTAIYDPVRDRMVVFGGNAGSGYCNDVWELSLEGSPAWSALAPAGTLPSARAEHTAIYDPVRDRMVVFGGYDGSVRNDVWALSLSGSPAWSALAPAGTLPSER